ncbi:hypothetical protein O9993_21315 [Vibrio lentus]|nr:hypothetical protein [Vibrio lentus]
MQMTMSVVEPDMTGIWAAALLHCFIKKTKTKFLLLMDEMKLPATPDMFMEGKALSRNEILGQDLSRPGTLACSDSTSRIRKATMV